MMCLCDQTDVAFPLKPSFFYLQALVTLEGGKISVPFPKYNFTAEIVDDKLVMVSQKHAHIICVLTSDISIIYMFLFLFCVIHTRLAKPQERRV